MVVIYAIECHVNGSAYIGCTAAKLGKRMREHRCLLNSGKHSAQRMVRDWQKYGEQVFSTKTLETLPEDATVAEKRGAELKWMEVFGDRLYNPNRISFNLSPEAIAKGVACAHNKPGNRWTQEANQKRRLAQLGIPKGHGAKISATKRAKRNHEIV